MISVCTMLRAGPRSFFLEYGELPQKSQRNFSNQIISEEEIMKLTRRDFTVGALLAAGTAGMPVS